MSELTSPSPPRTTTNGATATTTGASASTAGPAYGARVVALALVIVAAMFLPAVLLIDDPQDVVLVTAPAFTIVSGLVAAYLGTRAGTLAADRATALAATHR